MSLLSVSNILAPFSNRVHLTTIVLVGVMFVVLRLSGGAVDVRSDGETALPVSESKTSAAAAARQPAANQAARSARSAADRDLLRDMIGSDAEREAEAARKRAAETKKDGALDDIERSLGLR